MWPKLSRNLLSIRDYDVFLFTSRKCGASLEMRDPLPHLHNIPVDLKQRRFHVRVAVHTPAHCFPEPHFASQVPLFIENKVSKLNRTNISWHVGITSLFRLSFEVSKNLVVESLHAVGMEFGLAVIRMCNKSCDNDNTDSDQMRNMTDHQINHMVGKVAHQRDVR